MRLHSIAALLALAATTFAQDYRARVQGIVTDSSDAAVPAAVVTLRNNATGVTATRPSGPTGGYLFDNVEPGTYTVSAEFSGFSRSVQENVLVQTRADVTVNFSLKPGGTVETITVAGSAVTLQFNSTTRELTVDQKMLMAMPVKARNPFTLALLDPAVVSRYTPEKNPFFMWSSSSMDVVGSTNQKNDLLLDGAPIQIGPKGSYAPPMDAVQEFSIQQNSVDAEFGHSAGGTMSVSMTVSKTFPVRDRYRLEFRFEAYNLTDSLMWGPPNTTIGNSLFGRSTTQAATNRGREIQYTLRLMF